MSALRAQGRTLLYGDPAQDTKGVCGPGPAAGLPQTLRFSSVLRITFSSIRITRT